MRDVALVLSSGGARGLVHIGAIEELEAQGYRIRSIAGSSMGALVGGMFAAGRLKEFKEWILNMDKRKALSLMDLSLSLTHLVKGDKIIDAMKEIVPDVNIEDLPIEYKVTATDWNSGRELVFSSGSLYEAIRASISIPLFFSPVRQKDALLVDGGVLSPLPLKQGCQMAGDLLVAVNANGAFEGTVVEQFPETAHKHSKSVLSSLLPKGIGLNYATLFFRVYCMMIQQNAALSTQLYKPDILVDVPMNSFGGFDYFHADKICSYGREKMREALLHHHLG